jgi:hypothetical protein
MVTTPEELVHLLTEWHTVPVDEGHGFPGSFSRHTWNEGKKMFVFLEAYLCGMNDLLQNIAGDHSPETIIAS